MSIGKPWNLRTDDELWRRVLSQIAVVGKAEPGHRLQHSTKFKSQLSIRRLKRIHSDQALQRHLHKIFVQAGVRYVGRSWKTDRKARAAVRNFRTLTKTSPKRFFQAIAARKTETERIAELKDSLSYYGDKGARDILIELGLAKNCMALDVRIFGVLEGVGVMVRPEDIYNQIEKELINKVATPMGVSGAVLDRILFQNYNDIVKQLGNLARRL